MCIFPKPIPFDHPVLAPNFLDWSWPMAELLELVVTKAASMH